MDYPNEVAEVMRLGFAEGMPVVEAEIRGNTPVVDLSEVSCVESCPGDGNREVLQLKKATGVESGVICKSVLPADTGTAAWFFIPSSFEFDCFVSVSC